jgi:5-methylcytosine-specific restriction enzyme subunit McrC
LREKVNLVEFEDKLIELSPQEFAILRTEFSHRLGIRQGPAGKCMVSAKQFVGNIVLPDHVLIIRPKIPNINFFRMLFFTHKLLPEFNRKKFEYEKEEDIYEIIAKRFLEEVETIARRGLSKGYIEQEDNLSVVRERVLIQENIRRNSILKERVYCRFSDLTSDVPENHIIRFALYRLVRVPLRGRELIAKAKHLMQYFEQISPAELRPGRLPKVIYSRLNQHYELAVNLSILLIAYSTLNLQETGAIQFSSFLVDMNKLFQRFLYAYLQEKLPQWSIKSEPEYDFDVEREIIARPDIVVRRNGKDLLVMDAKYKKLQEEGGKQTIIHSDMYQIHAYAVRLNLPVGILVYPKHESPLIFKEAHTIGKTTILMWTIDLAKGEEEFVQECNQFVVRLSDLIQERVSMNETAH